MQEVIFSLACSQLLSEHLHQIILQQKPGTEDLWSASAISVSKWTDKKILGLLKCKNWGFLKSKTGGLQSFPLPTKWVGILYPSPSHFSVISLHLSSYFLLDCSCWELLGSAFCFEGAISVGVSSGEVIQFILMVQQTSLTCMCSSGNWYNIGFKNKRLKPWQKMPLTYSKSVRAFSDPLH